MSLFVVLSLSTALFLAPALAGYSAHVGDYLSYYEVKNLGNGGNSDPTQYAGYIAGIVLLILVVAILIYAFSRRSRRTLPKHSYQHQYPQPGPPPEDIDLTPKQPPVQQIVIKEVVKVKCLYCGALIDSTAEVCPICGAPRT